MTSADEIGRLGGTLNLLSARLSETIGTLSDEKTKLEKILSAIGEGIIAIDREGRVIHHNGAALNLLELKAWEVRPDDPHALSTSASISTCSTPPAGERTHRDQLADGDRGAPSRPLPLR